MKKEKMIFGYELGVCYRTWSKVYSKEFADITSLEDAFTRAYEILNTLDKDVIVRAHLTYDICFAPVPSNCGDCKFVEFTILDNRDKF